MGSNYNRKSGSSGSRKSASSPGAFRKPSHPRSTIQRQSRASSASRKPSGNIPGNQGSLSGGDVRQQSNRSYQGLSSVRVGDLNQAVRAHRVQKSYRRYVLRIVVFLVLLIVLLIAGIFAYNSSLFTITSVSVKGVEHLTANEMTALASVPAGTTLLRVDEAGIKSRLSEEAWVESVNVNRLFPDTLELVITERTIAAIVEVPTDNAQATEDWAMASDGMWLMVIPPEDSDEASSVSSQVYEDSVSLLRIMAVPYGLRPVVGEYCSDANVNNALSIVAGLTTSLSDQVKTVSATGTETTTLILSNGVEIAFGTAENIREKERVCLRLMEENPGKIAYINVRVVDSPTWRSL